MNDVQQKIRELRQKGWTLAAVADEVGVRPRAVVRWQAGSRYPENRKAVLALMDQLLKRTEVPPRRRYIQREEKGRNERE